MLFVCIQQLSYTAYTLITFAPLNETDDGKADIWSLGITLLELCEGNPPHFNVHPMRAIFIISSRPAPVLKEPAKWSADMQDFVGRCLIKNCEQRASATELLKHPWLRRTAKEIGVVHGRGLPVLRDLVMNNWEEIDRIRCSKFNITNPQDAEGNSSDDDEGGGGAGDDNNTSRNNISVNNILPAAAITASQSQAQAELESMMGSERSQYDDSTMRTVTNMSRNNSHSALSSITAGIANINLSLQQGVPATRQQMRNRSLSRPVTPVNTPGGGRNRGFSNATLVSSSNNSNSNNNMNNSNYGSDEQLAAAAPKRGNNNNNRVNGDSKYSDVKGGDFADYKGSPIPNDDNNGTIRRTTPSRDHKNTFDTESPLDFEISLPTRNKQ